MSTADTVRAGRVTAETAVPVASDSDHVGWRQYLQLVTGELKAEFPPPSSVRGFIEVLEAA